MSICYSKLKSKNPQKIHRIDYLFLLNKNLLFEHFDFWPKNQQKKDKNFSAAKPRIFPKKGGVINTGVFIEQEKVYTTKGFPSINLL